MKNTAICNDDTSFPAVAASFLEVDQHCGKVGNIGKIKLVGRAILGKKSDLV